MVLFFVNGALKVEKYDYLPENNFIDFYEYKMRFLTETCEPKNISITMFDHSNNELNFNIKILGLNVIELDCTPFIEKFNSDKKTYIRVNYIVAVEGNETDPIIGSFPIISPMHRETPLRIGCVSCNDNVYEKDDDNNGNLWEKLGEQNPDVILHVGNQIYGDDIYDSMFGRREDGSFDDEAIYNEYADLYRVTYSDVNQAKTMRNCINLMILEANDIYTSFGSLGSGAIKENKKFSHYYSAGMKAYLRYQHQLHSDLNEEFDESIIDDFQSVDSVTDDLSNIILGNGNIYYSMNYGKYSFIMMDQRYELYHRYVSTSDFQLRWVDEQIKRADDQTIILVSPRPMGNLTRGLARLYGFFSCEGMDDLLHPDNQEQTMKLIDLLNEHRDTDIKVISGYIRRTFINSLIDGTTNKVIAKQLSVGAITRVPDGNDSLPKRFSKWLMRKLDEFDVGDYVISRKTNISNGNSFGFIENDEMKNSVLERFGDLFCSCLSL